MITLYDEINEYFSKSSKILYGFTYINFSEYKDTYKSALVCSSPYKKYGY